MATRASTRSGTCCRPDPRCQPPSCGGLECLERPRFYAGQLLTEDELNALDAYVRSKDRLHNLHLHGWGTVCGLGVVCHDCDGWVTVEPGYAIDPCGNDVVVCDAHDFDVLGAIRACREARRRQDRAACRPRRQEDSDGVETWCLTLRYVEEEARPKAALRNPAPGCGGSSSHGGKGCGCGGQSGGGGQGCGCGCSCGGHGTNGCTCGSSAKTKTSTNGLFCEPTRTRESYRLELRQHDDDCPCGESVAERQWKDRFDRCGDILSEAVETLQRDDVGVLGQAAIHDLNPDGSPTQLPSANDQFTAYCQVLALVRELYRRNPGQVRCSIAAQLERLECVPPLQDETSIGFASRNLPSIQSLIFLLLQYFIDCFCHAFLPACAPCCPEDDELVLACITVRGDREIEHICNFSCRRFAGAFPPTLNGIHLGPLMPILGIALRFLCCTDWLSRILGDTFGFNAARFAVQDDFARLRFANKTVRDFDLASFLGFGEGTKKGASERINLAAMVGRDADEIDELGAYRGLEITTRRVSAMPPGEVFTTLRPARSGDRLIAFTDAKNRIVGFARAGSSEEAQVLQAEEVASLRAEVTNLRADLTKLGRAAKRKSS